MRCQFSAGIPTHAFGPDLRALRADLTTAPREGNRPVRRRLVRHWLGVKGVPRRVLRGCWRVQGLPWPGPYPVSHWRAWSAFRESGSAPAGPVPAGTAAALLALGPPYSPPGPCRHSSCPLCRRPCRTPFEVGGRAGRNQGNFHGYLKPFFDH